MVSLGCPKALVDSERILTRLRAEGYAIAPDYAGAEAVIVNTCGFLDSAKAESLEAIGEALAANGRVIVTGCLGADAGVDPRRASERAGGHRAAPVRGGARRRACRGAAGARSVRRPGAGGGGAPHAAALQLPQDFRGLQPQVPVLHHPRHARPTGQPPGARGAARGRAAGGGGGARAAGDQPGHLGLRAWTAATTCISGGGAPVRSHITDLARELGALGAWVRLHYVYPYPHVRELIPLMAEGLVLPYLDMPFQHSHPEVLRRMARPAASARTLDEIARWRAICPDLALRSTFIVGFPGETEAEFQHLLDWLDAPNSTGSAASATRTSRGRGRTPWRATCPRR